MSEVMFPPVKGELELFEKWSRPSVDVLVRVEGLAGVHAGRYFHGAEKWQINHAHGDWKVLEWWPMPEPGTGTAPPTQEEQE